ncbi:Flp pilus assembly protein CpaB [Paludisphaera rhizosphaerae]|uniref:Flp pilus assembly protein CpaB n=1 Tax=Paludisphaera rhizosphaerae TaxID=2711216 RepID=UPI0013E9C83F|nr:Flp pilus assembly protein CpaB [Paludisphaera rhizosphaerae]
MRPQTMLVAILALASGLAAVLGVKGMMKKPAVVVEEKAKVVTAKAELARAQSIEAAAIEVKEIPKSQVPEGALASIEETAGRIPSIPLLKGEIVVEPKLLPKGSRAGMASMIPPGMRAFTILTPTFSSSLAGFLQPGNRVDVLLTIQPPGSQGDDGSATTTILQNIELLAVHTLVDAPVEAKANLSETRSVTLLVTPRQASILDLAQDKGKLHLSLRNSLDETPVDETRATLADLGLPETPSKPEPAAPPPAIAAPTPPPPPEPEEPELVVLTVRTLRGTVAGRDEITVLPSGSNRLSPGRLRPQPNASAVASQGLRRPPR